MVREAFTDSPQATEGQHLQLGGELHEGKVPLRAIWSGPREDATGATDSLQAFATEAPRRMPRGSLLRGRARASTGCSRSVFDDLQDVTLPLLAARRRENRADCRRVRTPLPNHLPQVLFGDRELEHVQVAPRDLSDLDRLGSVHERLHDPLQKLFHP